MAIHNEANLGQSLVFVIGALGFNNVSVFTLGSGSCTRYVLVFVTHIYTVVLQLQGGKIGIKFNTSYSFSLVGHQLVNIGSSRERIHQCGARH